MLCLLCCNLFFFYIKHVTGKQKKNKKKRLSACVQFAKQNKISYLSFGLTIAHIVCVFVYVFMCVVCLFLCVLSQKQQTTHKSESRKQVERQQKKQNKTKKIQKIA